MYGKPDLNWLRYENCQKNAVKKIYGKHDLNWLRYEGKNNILNFQIGSSIKIWKDVPTNLISNW